MLRTLARTCTILALASTAAFAQTHDAQRPPQPAQAPQPAQTARPAQTAQPAQAPQPAQTPRPEQARPQHRPLAALPGQPINIRVEIAITDEKAGSAPVQKTVALVLADRTSGLVRSASNMSDIGSVPLNVDAEVALVDSERVLVQIAIDYNMPGGRSAAGQASEPAGSPNTVTWKTEVREQIQTILQSGKPVVVSESADPITDRKVKVEVTATILR